jgi:hypothetical protein
MDYENVVVPFSGVLLKRKRTHHDMVWYVENKQYKPW